MVSEIRFPEVPKVPVLEAFQPYLEAPKTPSKIDKILDKVFDFTESEQYKSVNFFSKFITTVFSIKRSVAPSDAAKDAHNVTLSVGNALSIVSGVGAAASLIKNLKKKDVKKEDRPIHKLEIFRSIMQIISGATSFLSILDRYKAIELAKITEEMGTIPVIGQGLARALPTTVVFSFFNILSSAATITISALKLKQIKGRIDKATSKIKKKWSQPIDEQFAERKIGKIISKQRDGVARVDQLKPEITQMKSTLKATGKAYKKKKAAYEKLKGEVATANKISRFMRTFKEKKGLKAAKADYKQEVKKYKLASNEIQTLEKTHKIRMEKGEKWEAIRDKFQAGTMTEEDAAALEKMRAEKVKKWKAKKVNELFDVAKHVSKIALTLISVALAVTMIALTIIFPGAIPAAAFITTAVVGLSVAAMQLMSTLYFNRIKKRAVESVAIPDFRTLIGTT